MTKGELQKHKFDQTVKLSMFIALLIFAAFLVIAKSPLAGEAVTLIIGLAGGNAIASKN